MNTLSLVSYLHAAASRLNLQYWGGFGLLNPPDLPIAVATGATVLALVLVIVAIVGVRTHRLTLAVAVGPIVLVGGALLLNGWSAYSRTGQPAGLQGRYLYLGVVGVAVAVSVGVDRLLGARRRWDGAAPLVACLLALSMLALGFRAVLEYYWSEGTGTSVANLREIWSAISAASAWPTAVTAVPFVLLGVFTVAALAAAVVRPVPSLLATPITEQAKADV